MQSKPWQHPRKSNGKRMNQTEWRLWRNGEIKAWRAANAAQPVSVAPVVEAVGI